MKISVIIPTYNEEACIGAVIDAVVDRAGVRFFEILVADGGSTDSTRKAVAATSAQWIVCPQKGRAAQMNYGASQASGELLFFLHADSLPPQNFLLCSLNAVKAGADAGCFRLRFDSPNFFLKFNAWFTRFKVNAVRFGDQGLFLSRPVFERSGGYREDHIVMEDQEMVVRLRKGGARFVVLPQHMITSARKYLDNGPMRLQCIFFLIWWHYYRGRSQKFLVELYQRKIKQTKIQHQDVRTSR